MEAAIEESIEAGAYSTGLWLAERLMAERGGEEAAVLAGRCAFLLGRAQAVRTLLRETHSGPARFLLARACVALREWREAELALTLNRVAPDWLDEVPGGAYGLALLGDVYRAVLQPEPAEQCYRAALTRQPLLWAAIEGLAVLGVEEDPSPLMEPQNATARTMDQSAQKQHTFDMRSPTPPLNASFATPAGVARNFAFDTPASAMLTPVVGRAGSNRVSQQSEPLGPHLATLARARWSRGRHEAHSVLEALQGDAVLALGGGWAQCELGRAHAELGEYGKAARCFASARRLEPWRVEGMEMYSTVLWHLKRESELAMLAHSLEALDRTAPETWIAVGNCFSLLKEHDAARRFFERSIQVDPGFAYAHTLCGHEHVATDDLDSAEACFRQALLVDPRHYNAWYGLGMIFYRTQRLPLADYHFSAAINLHPLSSPLHTYRGMVAAKQGRYDDAQALFVRALECNKRNVLARSNLAQTLITINQVEEGLGMVETMLESAPREAFLHFLKATACAKLGQKEDALVHYTNAMDLDAKNGPLIKTRIDRIFSNPLLGTGDQSQELGDSLIEDEFEIL